MAPNAGPAGAGGQPALPPKVEQPWYRTGWGRAAIGVVFTMLPQLCNFVPPPYSKPCGIFVGIVTESAQKEFDKTAPEELHGLPELPCLEEKCDDVVVDGKRMLDCRCVEHLVDGGV
jgi:hypothetical protein